MWNKLLTLKENFSVWQLNLDFMKVKNFNEVTDIEKHNYIISNIFN